MMSDQWHIKPLGNVCSLNNKCNPFVGQISYYSTGGVNHDGSEITVDRMVTFENKPSRAGRRPSSEDVGFAKMKGTRKVILIDDELSKSVFSTGFSFLKCNPEILPRYLYFFLRSNIFHEQKDHRTGDGIMASIRDKDTLQISFPFPPMEEQQRIVSILDVAINNIKIDTETVLKKISSNFELVQSIRHSHFSTIDEDREVMLDDICSRVSVGHVGPTSEFYCDESEGIPFLRSQNVRKGKINRKNLKYITKEFHQSLKKSRLQSGDLLFVRVGANRGDCCLVPDGLGELNCANIVFARPISESIEYLEQFFQSNLGIQRLLGMTTGSAQGVINTKSVAKVLIPIPPLDNQLAIVENLNDVIELSNNLNQNFQKELKALGELEKTILQEAFSGKLTGGIAA